MEKFITIVKHNYSWNQIRKIRRHSPNQKENNNQPKRNDKTNRIIYFYKINSKPFESHKK